MRNKFKGQCYKCGKTVDVGKGHFERHGSKWRVQCAEHAKSLSPINPKE